MMQVPSFRYAFTADDADFVALKSEYPKRGKRPIIRFRIAQDV